MPTRLARSPISHCGSGQRLPPRTPRSGARIVPSIRSKVPPCCTGMSPVTCSVHLGSYSVDKSSVSRLADCQLAKGGKAADDKANVHGQEQAVQAATRSVACMAHRLSTMSRQAKPSLLTTPDLAPRKPSPACSCVSARFRRPRCPATLQPSTTM